MREHERETHSACVRLCQIYFAIAAEAIGENRVRKLRDAALSNHRPDPGGHFDNCMACGKEWPCAGALQGKGRGTR